MKNNTGIAATTTTTTHFIVLFYQLDCLLSDSEFLKLISFYSTQVVEKEISFFFNDRIGNVYFVEIVFLLFIQRWSDSSPIFSSAWSIVNYGILKSKSMYRESNQVDRKRLNHLECENRNCEIIPSITTSLLVHIESLNRHSH